jgi:hypothetical protein
MKLWDARARKQVSSYKKHTDFISDAALHERDQVGRNFGHSTE